MSRAAVLLSASLSLAACGRREQQIAAVYGAPPPPAQVRDAAAPGDAARLNPHAPARPPQDPGGMAEVYGAPPPPPGDAGAAR